MTELIAIIVRSPSGCGKSTRVKEILTELGGTHENVFSTDNFYIPVALKLRHSNVRDLTLEEKVILCSEIIDMWYSGGWSDYKRNYEDNFLEFKALFDQSRCFEALMKAKSIVALLEKVEYTSKWNPGSLRYAHERNFNLFKEAVDARKTPVIVDNTNVDVKACRNYAKYAKETGYEVRLEEPTSEHWKAHRHLFVDKYANKVALAEFAKLLVEKNTHGVPLEGIERQISNWKHNLTLEEILGE